MGKLAGGITAVLRLVPFVKRLVPAGTAGHSTRGLGQVPAQRTGSDLFDQQSGVQLIPTYLHITPACLTAVI